jgi:hypothetical protein
MVIVGSILNRAKISPGVFPFISTHSIYDEHLLLLLLPSVTQSVSQSVIPSVSQSVSQSVLQSVLPSSPCFDIFLCGRASTGREEFAVFNYNGLPPHSASIDRQQRHRASFLDPFCGDMKPTATMSVALLLSFLLFIVAAGLKAASLHSFIAFVSFPLFP